MQPHKTTLKNRKCLIKPVAPVALLIQIALELSMSSIGSVHCAKSLLQVGTSCYAQSIIDTIDVKIEWRALWVCRVQVENDTKRTAGYNIRYRLS